MRSARVERLLEECVLEEEPRCVPDHQGDPDSGIYRTYPRTLPDPDRGPH